MQSSLQNDRYSRLRIVLAAAVFAVAALMCGSAARAADPAPSAVDDSGVLAEVTVTATRKETTLQQTPMSIAAFSGEKLQEIGVTSFDDVFQQTPGLSIRDQGPGDKRYAIRGIQAAGEPQVGLYYDEIPVVGIAGEGLDYGAAQPDVRLWDMERIEVLRGPQGTLYGAGSMGGTIRFISQRPELDAFHASGRVTAASIASGGNSRDFDGMLNVPIVQDRVGMRLTAYRNDDAGWVREYLLNTRDANTSRGWGGRFNLRAVPVEGWTVDLIAYKQRNSVGDGAELFPTYEQQAGTKWVAANYILTPFRDDFEGYNLISNTDLPWATLAVIGSYQHRRVERVIDSTRQDIYSIFPSFTGVTCNEQNYATCFPPPFNAIALLGDYNNDTVAAWSSEVRLASRSGGRLQWTLGVFYQNRSNFHATEVEPSNPDGGLSFGADGVLASPIYYQTDVIKTRQWALFGETGYELPGDIKASIGARWFTADRALRQNLLVAFGGFGQVGPYPADSSSESKTLLRFALSHDISKDALVFAQAAQGYRLGGPNLPVGFAAAVPAPYNADSLWDYEVGWKTSWLGRRLIFNGALFYMKWTNIQEQTTDPTGTFALIANGGSATVKGIELETEAILAREFELGGGLSFTDAVLDADQPVAPLPINQTYGGDRFPYVPRWTANLNATYRFDVGTRHGFVRWDGTYESGRTTAFNAVSPTFAALGGWFLTNLRAGVAFENVDLALFVNNIANRRTAQSGRVYNGNPLTITSAPPRTVGLQLTAKF